MERMYMVVSVVPHEGSHLLYICDGLDSVKKYLHRLVDDCDWYMDKLFVIDICANSNKELEEMELQSAANFL